MIDTGSKPIVVLFQLQHFLWTLLYLLKWCAVSSELRYLLKWPNVTLMISICVKFICLTNGTRWNVFKKQSDSRVELRVEVEGIRIFMLIIKLTRPNSLIDTIASNNSYRWKMALWHGLIHFLFYPESDYMLSHLKWYVYDFKWF